MILPEGITGFGKSLATTKITDKEFKVFCHQFSEELELDIVNVVEIFTLQITTLENWLRHLVRCI